MSLRQNPGILVAEMELVLVAILGHVVTREQTVAALLVMAALVAVAALLDQLKS